MKFLIERQRLLDACKKCLKVTYKTNSKSPELSGILAEADDANRILKLTGANDTVSIMVILKNVNVTEGGRAVIDAGLFTGMLGAMDGKDAAVNINNSALMLQCGNPIFHMAVMDAKKFPSIKINYPDNTICVSGLSLITRHTVADEKSSGQSRFGGVKLNFSPHISTALSTDSTQLIKSGGENMADGELEVFIPESSLKLICGMVKPSDSIYVGLSDNRAVFMTSEFVFATLTVNGNLNDVEKLVEKVLPKYKAIVKVKELEQAIGSCVTMTSGYDSCVDLKITENSVDLFIKNENGEAMIDVTAKDAITTEGMVFHYNPKFIYNFIRTCSGDAEIEINEQGILKIKSNISEYIVMPRNSARIKSKEKKEEKGEAKAAKTKSKTTTQKTKKGKADKTAA